MVLLGTASAVSAHAATYYLSDCQPGATPECIAGNDNSAGTSPAMAWRTIAKLNTRVEQLNAGDRILFARGASFKDASIRVFIPKSKGTKPVVFESYVPTWGTGAARPILTASREHGVFDFSDGGEPDHDEGYVVRGLDLRGVDHTGAGIFIYNDVDYITLEDLVITGFNLGVQCSASNPPAPGSSAKAFNDHITLRKSRIADNNSQGILTQCSHMVIEYNVFDDNGYERPRLDHNVYIEGGDHVLMRHNAVINNGRFDRTKLQCDSVPLVVHGIVHDLVIENNFIGESNASDGCWGLTVDVINNNDTRDGFYDVFVRGNKVVNVGGIGIGMVGCQRCFIENNQVMWTGASRMDHVGIAVPVHQSVEAPADGDIKSEQIVIRNNSIYLAAATRESTGIRSADAGKGHAVVSNMIYFGAASASSAACFSTGKNPLSSYSAFRHNLCFRAGGANRWSDKHGSLSSAISDGWAINSVAVDPQIVAVPSAANDWTISLKPTSPVRQAAHPTMSMRPDIGAGDLPLDRR